MSLLLMSSEQPIESIETPLDIERLNRISLHIKGLLSEQAINGFWFGKTHNRRGNPVHITLNTPASPGRYALRVRQLTGIEGRYVEHSWHPVVPETATDQIIDRKGFASEEYRIGFSNADLDEIASSVGYEEDERVDG